MVQGLRGGAEGEEALIAIDTNLLVYAFDVRAAVHREALGLVASLAEGRRPWGLPWPCVPEFINSVTGLRAGQPAPVPAALAFLDQVLASPTVRCLLPTDDTLRVLREVLDDSGVRGPQVHDAQIFALCLEHGVRELLTADKGFRRFRGLKVRDPFR